MLDTYLGVSMLIISHIFALNYCRNLQCQTNDIIFYLNESPIHSHQIAEQRKSTSNSDTWLSAAPC